ncbi:MAG: dihydroneopterin aldolase [Prochlorotrichaceae cyanobacterium]|jgi:dihydroneopterin aldolase
MDTLTVKDIRAYGYTGYFPEEQVLGQWFTVDVSFCLNLATAGSTDELPDTLDYSQVVHLVQTIVQSTKVKTVERLISIIADRLLTETIAKEVTVRLTKCQPPIPNFSGEITLEITRRLPSA